MKLTIVVPFIDEKKTSLAITSIGVIPKNVQVLVIDDGISSSVNTNFFAAAGKGIDSNTIARISLKSPPFNIQTQNDFSVYTEPRYYFGPVTISKFNISLRDEYNRIIDLNKNDMSFTLRLTIVYSD